MLNHRGYAVSEDDLFMSVETFAAEFGNLREKMTILTSKKDDMTDQIFAFFSDEQTIGVKQIRAILDKMENVNVSRSIVVVHGGITPYAKQVLAQAQPKIHMEQFKEDELLVNITEHELVPSHQLLTQEEKLALLKRYKLKQAQLPRIQLVDPVARYYGLARGQVVKIIRPSETAGRYVTYRSVV